MKCDNKIGDDSVFEANYKLDKFVLGRVAYFIKISKLDEGWP